MVKAVAVARMEDVTAIGVKLNSGSVTGGLIPEYKDNTHHMQNSFIILGEKNTLGHIN